MSTAVAYLYNLKILFKLKRWFGSCEYWVRDWRQGAVTIKVMRIQKGPPIGPWIVPRNVWGYVGLIWGYFGPRGRGPIGQNGQLGWCRLVPCLDRGSPVHVGQVRVWTRLLGEVENFLISWVSIMTSLQFKSVSWQIIPVVNYIQNSLLGGKNGKHGAISEKLNIAAVPTESYMVVQLYKPILH